MDDAKTLTREIDELCRREKIKCHWKEITDCSLNRACMATREIWVFKIRKRVDWAAALHEIGHVMCDPEVGDTDPLAVLDRECKATEWVIERYQNDLDLDCWKRMEHNITDYKAKVPNLPADHPVHTLLKTIQSHIPIVAPSFGRKPKPPK
jgi:hypothetical protein